MRGQEVMLGFHFVSRRMPAYNASSVFAVFFIVYILVNTYIFMSVFLAVVYNNYKKYLKVPTMHHSFICITSSVRPPAGPAPVLQPVPGSSVSSVLFLCTTTRRRYGSWSGPEGTRWCGRSPCCRSGGRRGQSLW